MNIEKKWYVIQSVSGREKSIAKLIREKITIAGLQDHISSVLVPSEKVTEIRRGKKVLVDKRFFPGYILINMHMDNNTYHFITSINGVYGFLGNGKVPKPMSDSEATELISDIKDNKIRSKIGFEIGEQVRVCDGPFASFNGFVESINEDKERLVILVSIFERNTPIELEYNQVEKVT